MARQSVRFEARVRHGRIRLLARADLSPRATTLLIAAATGIGSLALAIAAAAHH